jgi:hypothetical protein
MATTPPPPPPPPTAAGDALTRAADRIRATAQWLITAFAAVAAVLVAGSQLSDIGHLGGWRLAVAFISVVIAVAAVAYAIGQAAGVATAGRVSLGDLANPNETTLNDVRQRVNGDPALLAGYGDVAALSTDYAATLSQRKAALADYYANVGNQGKETTARVADAQAQAVDQAVQRLLNVASFYTLSKKFNDSRPRMFVGALVGALAIVGFAWAAHPPDKKTKPAVAAPAEVTIKLTKEGKKLLSAPLGKQCVARSVPAIVLATTAGTAEVVTLPRGGCRIRRFTVSADVGTIDVGAKATDGGGTNNNNKKNNKKMNSDPPTPSTSTTSTP